MLRFVTMMLVWSVCIVVRADDVVKAPEETGKFATIFNGTDLAGWDGDPQLWSVKDGVIHGETTAEHAASGNTFIIWKDGVTRDFELRLSFRCNATNNSGIQYRSKHNTEGNVRNKWVVRGYQHELRNEMTMPNVSGFIYDKAANVVAFALWERKHHGKPAARKSRKYLSIRMAGRSYSNLTTGTMSSSSVRQIICSTT